MFLFVEEYRSSMAGVRVAGGEAQGSMGPLGGTVGTDIVCLREGGREGEGEQQDLDHKQTNNKQPRITNNNNACRNRLCLSLLCAARNKHCSKVFTGSCIQNSTDANKHTCMHIHTIEATANKLICFK